jgi:hypothetical protein
MTPAGCRRPYPAAMAGRREDITPGHLAGSAGRGVEAPARGRGLRTIGLVAGLLLAVAATAAVVTTDEARYLRIALLACCWASLVAAFLAGGRRADQLAAQGREAELRHAYDLELEREVAAREAHELALERRLRAESEEGVRRELAALRADLAGLSGLRTDLAALGELRADLDRLRGELTDQLSGELLIERMVMRAQAVRLPADRSGGDDRSLDGVPAGAGPRSATWEERSVDRRPDGSGWAVAAPVDAGPGVRPVPAADRAEPLPVPPPVPRAARPAAPPVVATAPAEPAPAVQVSRPAVSPRSGPRWASPVPALAQWPVPSSAHPAPPVPSIPPLVPGPTTGRPTPAPRSRYPVGLDPRPATGDHATPRRHHLAAELDADRLPTGATRLGAHGAQSVTHPGGVPTPAERPQAQPDRSWTPGADLTAPEPASAPAVPADADAAGHARLEQILADSGAGPTPGRRRRRYRDEEHPQPPDDVLARVLRRP